MVPHVASVSLSTNLCSAEMVALHWTGKFFLSTFAFEILSTGPAFQDLDDLFAATYIRVVKKTYPGRRRWKSYIHILVVVAKTSSIQSTIFPQGNFFRENASWEPFFILISFQEISGMLKKWEFFPKSKNLSNRNIHFLEDMVFSSRKLYYCNLWIYSFPFL